MRGEKSGNFFLMPNEVFLLGLSPGELVVYSFATHALASGVDAKTLSGILGHTKASFTLDTYTHVTGDMQRHAAEIVGGFMIEMLGDELKPWESGESGERAASI